MSEPLSYLDYVKLRLEAESKLTIGQRRILIENRVRGICLTISADMEALLLRIMLYCRIDETETTLKDFTKQTLNWKLDNARIDLEQNEPSIYNELIEKFKELETIAKLRNKIAHCPFVWEGENLSYFKILVWSKKKGKFKPHLVKMTLTEFDKQMSKFKELIFSMLSTCDYMEKKIILRNPAFANIFQSSIFQY